jgi:hypothetical protein
MPDLIPYFHPGRTVFRPSPGTDGSAARADHPQAIATADPRVTTGVDPPGPRAGTRGAGIVEWADGEVRYRSNPALESCLDYFETLELG